MGEYDVIVVGARCAGSPLATLLARRGLSVCILDKADFPSETPSTHAIQPNGIAMLDRMGLASRLLDVTEPIINLRMAFEAARFEVADFRRISGAPAACIRRTTLDELLVKAARESGAELETMTAVTGMLRDDQGRVVGVRTENGDRRARLVVGADGTRSSVARLVGAKEYLTTELARSFLWGYFEGATPPPATLWIGKVADGAFLASPTDAGLQMVAISVDRDRWRDASRDLDATFAKSIALWPELADTMAAAQRVDRFRVMAHGNGYFRQSAGPGWVLVGDAGHFKDPTPGQGIADALRQVERLAPAIEAALTSGSDKPLHSWWRWRDRDAMQMYWLADTMGAAGPLPAVVGDMLTTLNSTEAGRTRFVRMMDHSLSPAKVMSTRLVARGLARGWKSRPADRAQLMAEARSLIAEGARQQYKSITVRR